MTTVAVTLPSVKDELLETASGGILALRNEGFFPMQVLISRSRATKKANKTDCLVVAGNLSTLQQDTMARAVCRLTFEVFDPLQHFDGFGSCWLG